MAESTSLNALGSRGGQEGRGKGTVAEVGGQVRVAPICCAPKRKGQALAPAKAEDREHWEAETEDAGGKVLILLVSCISKYLNIPE